MSPLSGDATRGVSDPDLAALLRDHWEWWMVSAPIWATTLGDHRYDDRIPSNSPADIAADREMARRLLRRVEAIPRARLSPTDAVTRALFEQQARAGIASEVCELHTWNVSAHGSPMRPFNELHERHPLRNARDADNFLARVRAVPASLDNAIHHLREGAQAGRFGNAESVRRAIAMADGQLATAIDDWPLMKAITEAADVLDADAHAHFAAQLTDIVTRDIAPAYTRYREFLERDILPHARTGDRAGLIGLPAGDACYAARIQHYLGQPRDAHELHALGVAEIRRINDAMRTLGQKLFGTDDLAAVITRLRTDESLYFDDERQLQRAAEDALASAKRAMSRAFGILPKADCVVVPIPEYAAPYTTIAYYQPPHYDGTKSGEYFINLYQPKTRPRFEIAVLSYHEAIPGHHLQIAIAQEREALPAVRKFISSTAFVEGWALYAEELADELGLYASDLDRMGKLSYDAWRASRLVVDTGIHAMGWTREQARDYMLAHTALTPDNIDNEVDRYIAWPGQALAYKVGQLDILRLRAWARQQLGDRFSLTRFHDTVLQNGAVSLPVLAQQIEAWVADSLGSR